MHSVIPVILSGGSGTRLWPLSRKQYPKQLLMPANGDRSLLQHTALRVKHLSEPIVVCNEQHRFMVADQLREINAKPETIILEPEGRNTAPAIAIAAMQAQTTDENAIIAVFPADHMITEQVPFNHSLELAAESAKNQHLVTLGIIPTRAETAYGYIKSESKEGDVLKVEAFVEKPDRLLAQQFLESGEYLWNSGIFVFQASLYLKTLAQLNPEIFDHCEKAFKSAEKEAGFLKLDRETFNSCPSESIDYAVMEKAKNVVVVPMDANWTDLGSWGALWDIAEKDQDNNVFNGDVIALNTTKTFSMSNKDKIVALVGLDNLVVIDTKDALLVANKDNSDQVKEVVAELNNHNRNEHLLHKEVYRPWGSYESLDEGNRFQVKHIKVKPGASLSLQMHHHRSEHWIVVTGCALVQIGEDEKLLTENESVYIPSGEKHRLTNPGKLMLELIEVQSGAYLGEDDITRFEDIYQRV